MKMPQQMLLRATGASSFSGSSSSGSAASSFGAPSFCFSALMCSSFALRFSACASRLFLLFQMPQPMLSQVTIAQLLSRSSADSSIASAFASWHPHQHCIYLCILTPTSAVFVIPYWSPCCQHRASPLQGAASSQMQWTPVAGLACALQMPHLCAQIAITSMAPRRQCILRAAGVRLTRRMVRLWPTTLAKQPTAKNCAARSSSDPTLYCRGNAPICAGTARLSNATVS